MKIILPIATILLFSGGILSLAVNGNTDAAREWLLYAVVASIFVRLESAGI